MADGTPGVGPESEIWRQGTRTAKEYADAIDQVLKAKERAYKAMKKGEKIPVREELALRRLRKTMLDLRTESGHWGKAMEGLTKKFQGQGGVTGAVTRFASSLPGLGASVDASTGKMNILGQATKITAGTFNAYVGTITAVVGATVAIANAIDKARIKQAEYIKNFGALGNISIETPFLAQARGISIAGEAGAAAAEQLMTAITKMRGGGALQGKGLVPGGGREADEMFDRSVLLTTGVLSKTPEYLTALRQVFAMKPGKEMTDEITKIAHVAFESQVPMEQFADQVFALGAEFVHVGMKTQDATALLGQYSDAVGKSQLPMQMVIDFAKQTMGELTTAGGVEKLFMAAHFATQGFGGLDKNTQSLLNKAARGVSGGKKDWKELGIGQQAAAFQGLGKGEYGPIRAEIFENLIKSIMQQTGGELGMGGQIAKILSVMLTGQEWLGFGKVAAAKPGGGAETAQLYVRHDAAVAAGDTQTAARLGDELATKQMEFNKFAKLVSIQQKEWYSAISEEYVKTMGLLTSFMTDLTGRSIGAKEKMAEAYAAQQALSAYVGNHPELALTGITPEALNATVGPGGFAAARSYLESGHATEDIDHLGSTRGPSWNTNAPSGPSMVVETPEGMIVITGQFVPRPDKAIGNTANPKEKRATGTP